MTSTSTGHAPQDSASQPWIVIFQGMTADAPVYATEEAARAMIERTKAETAGNVQAIAMPLRLAVAAPKLARALRALQARIDACALGPVHGGREIADTIAGECAVSRALLRELGEAQ